MPQLISNLSQLTADAVAAFQKATLNSAKLNAQLLGDDINKAITQATGLVWYDLQAPAKNLFPVITPIRNKVPRVSGNGGTATNWIAVTAINTTSLQGFVPEGTRNGTVTTAATPKSASYKSLGLEDSVTFEADLAAVNFEDIRATTAQRLLWATMIQEELADLGGNVSVALGTPTAPTVSSEATGGSVAAGTYNVIVVALTLAGKIASSVAGGVVGQVSVTPADGGSAFTYGGGSSQKSAATSTGALIGATNVILAYTPVVTGAVAYAWYIGTAGSERLQAITTINSLRQTAALSTTTQLASAITADNSLNSYAYDGVMYQAWGASSGAYISNLATGTEGVGTPLTSDGAGGIVQIDAMLQDRWDNYRLGFDCIYVNSQEAININKKVIAAGGAPLFRFVIDAGGGNQQGGVIGGSGTGSYVNKFSMGGPTTIPIEIHPYVPAGTIVATLSTLPYPINNVPNVWEKKLRRDYYQMEWPLRTRKYETGVYFDGVLAHYFPPSIGIITNIGNG